MKILFIGARLFDDVALYAEKKGITTILTESNPKASNLKLADSYYIVSRGMVEPKEIALKEDVDAIIPLIGVDGPLLEIAKMKEELEGMYGLPVITSGVAATSISGDKIKTKEFLTANRIKTPQFSKISEKSFIPESNPPLSEKDSKSLKNDNSKNILIKEHLKNHLPLVLKQAEGQGGSGVKVASSPSDIDNYFEEVGNDLEETFLEKFIDGIEVSIEVLRYNNKSVPLVPVYKGNTTLEGIHPLNKVKKAPLEIDGINNQQNNQNIRELADKIANLVGVEGTVDIDLIFDKETKQNYVIEMNTRPSGTRYITAASTGINPVQELVNMVLGEWDARNIKKMMKSFSALEIPVGSYDSNRNNYKFRDFPEENSWIVHGPANYERVTIRGKTYQDALKNARNLNINFEI
jgi:carbamoylphosphate synthase large subunit